MPTANEVKAAQAILREALSDTALAVSTDGQFDRLEKIANNNRNVGLKPLLALTASIISKAREFKR